MRTKALTDEEVGLVDAILLIKRQPRYQLLDVKTGTVSVNNKAVAYVKDVNLEKNTLVLASTDMQNPKFTDFILNLN